MHRGVMFQYFEWNCKNDGSLWRELAARARELRNLGSTAIWMPPAYKGMGGVNEVGYGVYDLYDLGEFDQKGAVRTKYGTRAEFLAAVKAVRDAGMNAYADVVLNHMMGADETEEVEVEEVSCTDRNLVLSPHQKVHAWAKFNFPGRGETYSAFKWRAQHFKAFGQDGKIYRATAKGFSGEVCFEHGNFDFLMGADIDHYHADVRADLFRWGEWFVQAANFDGFRLDAVKHIPASFYKDWFTHLRARFPERELFGVAEYWSGNLPELENYLHVTDGLVRLFDVPLHYRLMEASRRGRDFDLSKIFDGTLVKENPMAAVTFVDNHDSQPGQALESWIDDWFKPLAYALILLRRDGYPCVFYGDYFGNPGDDKGNNKLLSHRKLIDDFLQARAKYTHGDQHDYFDHPQCIGWLWSGTAEVPCALAVIMSTGDEGWKKMQTFKPNQTFRDLTGHWPEPVTANDAGEAEFRCPAGKVSVWVMC